MSYNLLSRSLCCQKYQDYDKVVADLTHQRSDSERGVDTVGIYVENHEGRNRESIIWIQFDHRRLGEKGCIPLLLEDCMISETCALEESVNQDVSDDLTRH